MLLQEYPCACPHAVDDGDLDTDDRGPGAVDATYSPAEGAAGRRYRWTDRVEDLEAVLRLNRTTCYDARHGRWTSDVEPLGGPSAVAQS